ncbi:hypothetical protein Q0590_30725 [Rhodocytophaga aerolata]|uniref:Uncharacterized protein n=1 Tax=Rhodocytophaga aerolata TaxID=455078 RepID=A0ABT8RHP0_9BACT|nr:hypothetical protein [Rhodocytophaga aerolata]MDO1450688.1 hypothetical protein [Rhodocytophaga aerolata]
MIQVRLESFRSELKQKTADTLFTVNETRFICERAILLINDYYRPGVCQLLKEQTIAKLEAAIDQAALYYWSYDVKTGKSNTSFNCVVWPAFEAIDFFLLQIPISTSSLPKKPACE